jgi:hypothetical protein
VAGWFNYPLALANNKMTPGDLLLAVSAKTKVEALEDAQAGQETPRPGEAGAAT